MRTHKTFKAGLFLPLLLSAAGLAGCGNAQVIADTVVYSNVYTSNANHDYVEAFAVKDGKYVYVGTKEGVKPYIKDGTTKVLDKTGGFVMAGATEGHGHYVMSAVMSSKNLVCSAETVQDAVAYAKTVAERDPSQSVIFTYGWQNEKLKSVKAETDVRALLDEISTEKPIILIDDSGHNIFMNSKTIEQAGITPEWKIEGGTTAVKDGRLLGLASDIAMNYVLNLVLKPAGVLTREDFAAALASCEDILHGYGYTSYLDAYTSYFGDCAYEGISAYDERQGLTICMTASYKIDNYENVEKQVGHAASLMNQYSTSRFHPNTIKVFADGECFENRSAWVTVPYKDGTYGERVWKDEVINSLVKQANEKGVAVHAHASGDAAAEQMVNAYIASEGTAKNKVANSLGHCAQLKDETKDLMASHKIPSATNITWRIKTKASEEETKANFDWDYFMKSYPMKSLLDRGIVMSSSTDYPANSGAPCDILTIMQIAVDPSAITGDLYFSFDTNECITLQQALDVFTINGAKQLGIDKERGSIEVGKYADFVYIDKDIAKTSTIVEGKIAEVFFEGNSVYTPKK